MQGVLLCELFDFALEQGCIGVSVVVCVWSLECMSYVCMRTSDVCVYVCMRMLVVRVYEIICFCACVHQNICVW